MAKIKIIIWTATWCSLCKSFIKSIDLQRIKNELGSDAEFMVKDITVDSIDFKNNFDYPGSGYPMIPLPCFSIIDDDTFTTLPLIVEDTTSSATPNQAYSLAIKSNVSVLLNGVVVINPGTQPAPVYPGPPLPYPGKPEPPKTGTTIAAGLGLLGLIILFKRSKNKKKGN